MTLADKLFCRIYGSSDSKEIQTKNSQSTTQEKEADAANVLKQFIAKSPEARYIFDSERNAPQSELCRDIQDGERRRECIMIQMQSTKLFQAMQDNGFFCALPIDPTQNHIECTPKPQ